MARVSECGEALECFREVDQKKLRGAMCLRSGGLSRSVVAIEVRRGIESRATTASVSMFVCADGACDTKVALRIRDMNDRAVRYAGQASKIRATLRFVKRTQCSVPPCS